MVNKNKEEDLRITTVDTMVDETKESLRIHNLINKLGELHVKIPTVWEMDYLPRFLFYCLFLGVLACIGILYVYIILELSISFKSLGIIIGVIVIFMLNYLLKNIYSLVEKVLLRKSIYSKVFKGEIKKSSNEIGISVNEYIWLIEELIEAKEKYSTLTFMKEILKTKNCNIRKAEEEYYSFVYMDMDNGEGLKNNIMQWFIKLKNNEYRQISRIDEDYFTT